MECQTKPCNEFGEKYIPSEENSSVCEAVDLCSRENYFYPPEFDLNKINSCFKDCEYIWFYVTLSLS